MAFPVLPARTLQCPRRTVTTVTGDKDGGKVEYRKEIRRRKLQLDEANVELYPRYSRDTKRHVEISKFYQLFDHYEAGAIPPGKEQPVEVEGRIQSIRNAGKRLTFLDIVEGRRRKLQVIFNFGPMERKGVAREDFMRYRKLLHRGDFISIVGHPHRQDTGQLCIKAIELPKILSPCLHDFPQESPAADPSSVLEWQKLDTHVEMLTSRTRIQTIIWRSSIIRQMRDFFENNRFYEVQTPILAASAGGAIARPFETTATEFPDRKLALRIAPELWMKRLIIGGMEKIYEIGPCFRNEGLDQSHNPEFYTCEFYAIYNDLPKLMSTTEDLFEHLMKKLSKKSRGNILRYYLDDASADDPFHPYLTFRGPFPKIDFIPALNAALGIELPNLASPKPDTLASLLNIFQHKSIPIPSNPTLPRLLDKLCSTFLEPECQDPTWITNIPECLSPLSKSFIHPTVPNEQPVAARAELFIGGREIVNCYEEENDPSEQRRKFQMQAVYANSPASGSHPEVDPEMMKIDEDYLRALEWGLPPTGGWGCGIDRLVMLLTGNENIGNVLSFGNLRAVTRVAERREKDDVDLNTTEEVEAFVRDGDARQAEEAAELK